MQETSNSQEVKNIAVAQEVHNVQESGERSTPANSHQNTSNHHHRRRRNQQQQQQQQVWKLPGSSVQEYVKWIEEKGADRTEAEQKFLWKYQRRRLIQQDKLTTETLREYVFRLLQKEERTPAENRLIRQFRRQKAAKRERKAARKQNSQVFWKRNNNNNNNWRNKAAAAASSSSSSSQTSSALAMTSNLATLRESMDKLGLSSQKLRDTNMES